jgi:starvation-inducible DNA-binding protein
MDSRFTIPGLDAQAAQQTAETLQERLVSMIDLTLTLKHVHWNVVGPTFIGVHEMLDPQYEAASRMVDELAERIATLGGSPMGTPGSVVSQRRWDDYPLGRAMVRDHLVELERVYDGLLADHRGCIDRLEDLDPVSQDILIDHAKELEQFQWFVRAHLEDSSGHIDTERSSEVVDLRNGAKGKNAGAAKGRSKERVPSGGGA